MTQSENRLFLIQSLLKERPEYRQVETPRDPEGQRQLLRGLMNVRPPQAADPDFLRVQDAYLQAEYHRPGGPDPGAAGAVCVAGEHLHGVLPLPQPTGGPDRRENRPGLSGRKHQRKEGDFQCFQRPGQ